MNKVLKNVSTRINRQFYRTFTIDKNNNYRNSVLLAGSGRSGTTWVSNIINYDNEYRYMFEPFHPDKVAEFKDFGFHKYIRENTNDDVLLKRMESVLTGSIKNKWIDGLNKRIVSDKRLIKVIRGNLFLKYISRKFPEIPIVFLMRHPCAVTNSRIKLNWRDHLDDLLKQEEVMKDFLNEFKAYIEGTLENGSIFEKHVMMWCIENYIPLKQMTLNKEFHVVFYENLAVNPEEEMGRLFKYIDKKYDQKVYSILSTPSDTVRKDSSITNIQSWKKNINKDQIKKAKEILEIFDMDKIYTDEFIGDYQQLDKFMKC
ncbi:sulfotransferase [Gracilibacillus sp. YIM 98692]|uniref:sulfotransferase n=1 Tax=Gracilibacillus sp. YIM 98692 TaxID=2663532 RepID=UPI0013CF4232|nr:sulfotransferase [Gracilibacillus sp. YIM 98692]